MKKKVYTFLSRKILTKSWSDSIIGFIIERYLSFPAWKSYGRVNADIFWQVDPSLTVSHGLV